MRVSAALELGRASGQARPTRPLARSGALAWLLPSTVDLLFLTCLLTVVAFAPRFLSADGDPGRHLTVGGYILTTGAIPQADVFSHTMAGQPFVPYEWLAEVLSALSYRVAGLAGPVLLHGAVIGLTFVVLLRHLLGRDHPRAVAVLVTVLAVSASLVHWLARPHVFTFLGAAVFAAVLDGWQAGRLGRRWLWTLAPAMLLWANLHGGFLIGLILIGAYLGADLLRCLGGTHDQARGALARLRTLLPLAGAVLLATLANPAGPALLTHATGYLGKRLLVDLTQEYTSPDFHSPALLPFVALLLALLVVVAWSRRRPSLHEGLLMVGFTYFALYSQRNIPLFAIVLAPPLAAQLAELPRPNGAVGRALGLAGPLLGRASGERRRAEPRTSGLLWPALAFSALFLLAAAQQRAGLRPLGVAFDPALQPVAAADYLVAHPPAGRGFNQLRWGGYLLHRLWPAQQVFIDGQTDFYGEPLTREYMQVSDLAAGWSQPLDRRGIDWIVYSTDSALVRTLAASGGWNVAHRDALATVLIRAQPVS